MHSPLDYYRCFQSFRSFRKGIHIKVHRLIVFHFLKDLFQMLFGIKDRRLIHIIPEAVNSLVDQNPVLIAKPLPCLIIEHIRKAAFPGPYPDNKILSVFVLAEVSVLFSFFVDIIAIFLFTPPSIIGIRWIFSFFISSTSSSKSAKLSRLIVKSLYRSI